MFVQGIKTLSNINPNNYGIPAFCANPRIIAKTVNQGFNPALVADTIKTEVPTIRYAIINGKYGMVIESPKKTITFEEPKSKKNEIRKFEDKKEKPKKTDDSEDIPSEVNDDIDGFDPSPNPFSWESIQYDM